MNRNLEINNALQYVKNNKFYIYGAGAHCEKLVLAMRRMNCYTNVLGIAVTENRNNTEDSIVEIDKINRNEKIVIAAHIANEKDMENNLIDLGFKDYISIYPYIIEICCGLPYAYDVYVNIEEFIIKCASVNKNYLSILYLAIQYINGENKCGKSIYYKAMEAYSNIATADRRWNMLVKRCNKANVIDDIRNYRIKINPVQGFILDGNHRFILAMYYGIKQVKADYYSIDYNEYGEYFDQSWWQNENISNLYSYEEMNQINWIKNTVF